VADFSAIQLSAAWREAPMSQGVRLLLVEDDAAIRSTLAEMLGDEGYAVTAVGNGREALEELRAGAPPDVILLDLMMPVMDGWEFRVKQRADPLLGSIPLLAMSADLSAKAQAIAADSYVRKPIDFPQLVRELNTVVGRATSIRLAVADRMAALGTLASGIAHEINNPLTYVIANLQTLAEQLPVIARPGDARAVGDRRRGAGRRRADSPAGEAGADGVSRPARGTVHDGGPARRPGDGGDADRKPHQAPRAPRPRPGRRRPRARRSRTASEQLFVHLLLNAAQAIPEGHATENQVRDRPCANCPARAPSMAAIADTGTGIPLEVQERIFQPFFTTKPIGQGNGPGPFDLPRNRDRARGPDLVPERTGGAGPPSGLFYRRRRPRMSGDLVGARHGAARREPCYLSGRLLRLVFVALAARGRPDFGDRNVWVLQTAAPS
jgi:CheY-like chemotaxis protein